MHAVMRYTVKADQLQSHLDCFATSTTTWPTPGQAGSAWTTYRVTGTRTFVEFVEGPELPQPLPQLESFRRYRVGLDDRCEGDREFLELQVVGTFHAAEASQ